MAEHDDHRSILVTLVETLHQTALAVHSVSESVKCCVDALLLRRDDTVVAPVEPILPPDGGAAAAADTDHGDTEPRGKKLKKPNQRKVYQAECYARSFRGNPTSGGPDGVLSNAYGEPHHPVDLSAETDEVIDEQTIPISNVHQMNTWRQSIYHGASARIVLNEGDEEECASRLVVGGRLRRAKRMRDALLSAPCGDDGTAPVPRWVKANERIGVHPRYGRWKGAGISQGGHRHPRTEAAEPLPAETDAAVVYDDQSIPTSDAQQLNVWRKATVESVRAPAEVVGQP